MIIKPLSYDIKKLLQETEAQKEQQIKLDKEQYCVTTDWQLPYAKGIALVSKGLEHLVSMLKANNVHQVCMGPVNELIYDLEEFEQVFWDNEDRLNDDEHINHDELFDELRLNGFIESINDDNYDQIDCYSFVDVSGEDIEPEILKEAVKIINEGFSLLISAHGLG